MRGCQDFKADMAQWTAHCIKCRVQKQGRRSLGGVFLEITRQTLVKGCMHAAAHKIQGSGNEHTSRD